jgi:hypothetical protein
MSTIWEFRQLFAVMSGIGLLSMWFDHYVQIVIRSMRLPFR